MRSKARGYCRAIHQSRCSEPMLRRDALKGRFFSCFTRRQSTDANLHTTTNDAVPVLDSKPETSRSNGEALKGLNTPLTPSENWEQRLPRHTIRPPPRARARKAKGEASAPRYTVAGERYYKKDEPRSGDTVWRRTAHKPPYVTRAELQTLLGALNPASEAIEHLDQRAGRPPGGRRKRHNREHHLDKGPLAWDWRQPLNGLLQYTEAQTGISSSSGGPNSEEDELLSLVRSNATLHTSLRVDQIPVPEVWSRSSLAQYVYDLTKSHVSSAQSHIIYGVHADHRSAVMARLVQLFDEPTMRPFLSRTSFHSAMLWLHQASYVNFSRRLFFSMADLLIPPSRETFHILFADISSKGNLHAFASLLNVMLERAIRPDGRTWYWFFHCIDSRLVKHLILDHMKSLGLLKDLFVLRATTTELASIEFGDHVSNGGSDLDFIKKYDEKFGPEWFCTSAANSMCHTLGLSNRYPGAIAMLDVMQSRHCKPGRDTLEVLLKGLRRIGKSGDLYGCIELLRVFKSKFNIEPDIACLDIVFRIGWENARPNFCRVIWQYGCLTGQITAAISVKAMKALAFSAAEPREALSRFPFFYTYPAKVVAGILYDHAAFQAQRDLRQAMASGAEAVEVTEKARGVRNNDLAASQFYDFGGDLPTLLQEAISLDKEWVARPEVQQGDVDWMQKHAIKVPFVHRQAMITTSPSTTGEAAANKIA